MNWFTGTIYAITSIYMLLNIKRDIHAFQLNSYRPERFWRWLRDGHIMNSWHLTDIALVFLICSTLLTTNLSALLVGLVLLYKIVLILKAKYKKPLVFTKRVIRLYCCTAIIGLAAYASFAIWCGSCDIHGTPVAYSGQIPVACMLLLTSFSWIVLFLAAFIMTPVERMINRRYYRDAQRILRSMPDLKIIGITGSFGKTSTKHYLHTILSEKYDTLMTPGSFNTPMGVIRTVREHMKPYNEVFICEMGAKQKGDIKEICDLVHPSCGIITAVGPMHLETFHSIDNVRDTKFELADSIPSDGFVVINNDFAPAAAREVTNTEAIRYAVVNTEGADYIATEITYDETGTSFTVKGSDGFSLCLRSHLIGECNISNILAATVMAIRLGVDPERIQRAVQQIEQVEHRLSLKRTPGGVTIIDDAFNSNPEGSRMAVEALCNFRQGRRIIVTPGMIELGERQHELNAAFGEHIGKNADIAFIVGNYNRDAIIEGIRRSGEFKEENIIIADTFADAQKQLQKMLRSGDTVLYENDLPDTFK